MSLPTSTDKGILFSTIILCKIQSKRKASFNNLKVLTSNRHNNYIKMFTYTKNSIQLIWPLSNFSHLKKLSTERKSKQQKNNLIKSVLNPYLSDRLEFALCQEVKVPDLGLTILKACLIFNLNQTFVFLNIFVADFWD